MVEVAQKRNVAVVAHHGAGKTSLVEAMLYMLGKIDRMGKTEDGNTFSDFTDEARKLARQFGSSIEAPKAAGGCALLIAATALAHGFAVLTRDVDDFSRVPGLSVFPARPA